MTGSDVTRDGVRGTRPGRDAPTGKHGRRRRGRGERSMVPDAEFSSYYGRPILNKPTWKPLDIAGYLYLGGLAGGSSLLAAGHSSPDGRRWPAPRSWARPAPSPCRWRRWSTTWAARPAS